MYSVEQTWPIAKQWVLADRMTYKHKPYNNQLYPFTHTAHFRTFATYLFSK